MNIPMAAMAMMTLPVMPAHAQANRPRQETTKAEEKKPVVDENAYKAALERIPESREKYDPWGVARPGNPPGNQSKQNGEVFGIRV
ncbi:MAG: hypothetical protein Q8R73_25180 [Bradyrhizobium sp.]|nr:hypothetical protein [Bradyrhizobium sp.]MDP3694317.1 hypothetical protein [Bradyrhizobium sp.]